MNTPALKRDILHLWIAPLNSYSDQLEQLSQVLSQQERDIAASLSDLEERQLYSVAHVALRQILAGYLDIPPNTINFFTNPSGKPFLVLGPGQMNLCFNYSRSRGFALVGAAIYRRVGVDLKYIQPIQDPMQAAQECFSPGEIDILKNTLVDQKQETFYQIRTLKEACIKATGEVLFAPASQMDVTALFRYISKKPQTSLIPWKDPITHTVWSVIQYVPAPGFIASAFIEGQVQEFDIRFLHRPIPGA